MDSWAELEDCAITSSIAIPVDRATSRRPSVMDFVLFIDLASLEIRVSLICFVLESFEY
jgi:hypothetical protein